VKGAGTDRLPAVKSAGRLDILGMLAMLGTVC